MTQLVDSSLTHIVSRICYINMTSLSFERTPILESSRKKGLSPDPSERQFANMLGAPSVERDSTGRANDNGGLDLFVDRIKRCEFNILHFGSWSFQE